MEYVYEVLETLQANAWFILFGCLAVYYLFNKYNIRMPEMHRPQSFHRPADEKAQLKEMERIEAVRQRQQAAMDAAAAKYLEEKKKKEAEQAKQREEDLNLQQQGLSTKARKNVDEDLGSLGLARKNLNATSKPRLKNNDYNPLTGQSSSGNDAPRCTFKRNQPRQGG